MKLPTLTGWLVSLACAVLFYGAAFLLLRWAL